MSIEVGQEAALHSHLGSIPGCRLISVKAGGPTVTLVVRGWSAALYERQMTWEASGLLGLDAETILAGVGDRLRTQRLRAAAGVSCGTALPFDINQRDAAPAVDHLHMDASQLALLLRTRTDNGITPLQMIMREVIVPLRKLHLGRDDGRGAIHSDTCSVTDDEGVAFVSVAHRIVHGGTLLGRPVIKGETLSLSQNLPESTLPALVGRRVSDVLDTDRLVATRRIETAKTTDDGVTLRLVPLRIRLGDVARLDRREALDQVQRRLADAA